MPELGGPTSGPYISPWQEFRFIKRVRVVNGRNGHLTFEAVTPCGWIFHFAAIPDEHPAEEAEFRRFADELNKQLAEDSGTFDFAGWELIGAEAGSKAATFPDTAETRAVDAFWRDSRIERLHEEHRSSRGKWS